MKKFLKTFLILFIITIAFIPVIAKDTYVLKTGVSIDEVPDAIFGSWSVQAVIVDSSNYRKFKPKSTDLWNISRQGNVLNLSNPFTGASANVSINAAQGNVVSFTRKNHFDNNQVLIDVVTVRLNENTFSGINDIRLEQYSAVNNKLIKSDSARYEIKGQKLSGDSVLK